ncbi:Protein of unknown function DUF2815 [uncultured Caudovirales phage]|uniref:Uncharacterized protein n=1 Tax=uncultured Caudovirales phage TaxID=2100421 RepID=A0A6J5RW32_9CAUD|nr:Protein of unknown function DUF2815 [uncultured Caudovirales phage]CAB4197811.1 Protein of unknown function DUF2815 [uncultured Caudovirales phage]CAB4211430.1 Protein of unknown function DUF2815 [uncultured Caudovirales phage]CAB5227078.1 Protein of unknown function DUF2815 [uncultured Caudovirales phage]
MATTERVDNQAVKLLNVRLSYPKIWKAEYFDENEPQGKKRFSAAFHIEPGSDNFKRIEHAIETAAAEKFKDKAPKLLKGFRGNSNKFCFIDGDTKNDDTAEGVWVLSSHRNEDQGRPGIYDRDKTPLSAEDGRPYAGCYVNAMVEIWAQDGTNSGVRCKLLSMQFYKDGEAFSGGRKPQADDYEVVEEEELA